MKEVAFDNNTSNSNNRNKIKLNTYTISGIFLSILYMSAHLDLGIILEDFHSLFQQIFIELLLCGSQSHISWGYSKGARQEIPLHPCRLLSTESYYYYLNFLGNWSVKELSTLTKVTHIF